MSFPRIIQHRNAGATTSGKSNQELFDRVAYRVDGKRRMKSLATYCAEDGAKKWAVDNGNINATK